MPRLSDTMEVGTILHWHVEVGADVSAGDLLADIETDKATMELQAFDDGKIKSLLVREGEQVSVGTTIALLLEEDEPNTDTGTAPAEETGQSVEPQLQESEIPTNQKSEFPTETLKPVFQSHEGGPRVSPVARRLAEEHGVDIRTIQGSGPSGRIIKRDVLQVLDTVSETTSAAVPTHVAPSSPVIAGTVTAVPVRPLAPTSPWQSDRTVPLSNMRQIIAQRLVESKQTIPHYQVTMVFDVDPLLEMRKTLNEQLVSAGVKLSLNDFIVRCCALAMASNPDFNASFGGDSILYHGPVNVGIAIALPEERGGGLVVGNYTKRRSKESSYD